LYKKPQKNIVRERIRIESKPYRPIEKRRSDPMMYLIRPTLRDEIDRLRNQLLEQEPQIHIPQRDDEDHIIRSPPTYIRQRSIEYKNVPTNQTCKNHYGKGFDACSEMMPFCCPENTKGYGSCRVDLPQCSKIGKVDESKVLTKTKIPKELIRKSEKQLSEQGKDYIRNKVTTDAEKKRKETLKSVARNAPGCGRRTLEYLGPFGADNIRIFYEHELHVDPKYLIDVNTTTMCQALNRAIKTYDLRSQNDSIFISLHEFLKTNIVDYLFQQIERDVIDEYKSNNLPMDTNDN